MNIFFIVALFILFFSILQGWRKGILGLVIGFVSWIFIFVFVAFTHPYVEDYIRDNTKVYDKVYEKTEQYIQQKEDNIAQESGLEEWWAYLTEGMPQNILEKLQTKMMFQTPSDDALELTTPDQTKQKIKDDLVRQVADFVIQGIAVIVTFVIAEIFVVIVTGLVKSIGKLPVIRGVNNFLGIIAGAVEGFIIIWIVMYIVAFTCSTTIGQGILADINASRFLTYLYNHNLVVAFIATL